MRLRIREIRKAKGWSVEVLAEKVGLSKSYVSEIERGVKIPNQTRVQQIAGALSVPVLSLLEDIGLTEDQRELLENYENLDPKLRAAILEMSRAHSGG